MQNPKDFCNVTLVSKDSEKMRAHKVVMASVSTGSEHDDKNI